MIEAQALIDKFRYALDNDWGYIWGKAGSLWTEAQQKAATREQTVKYGAQWIGHYVADCSGLFAWAFKQLGSKMYHGSNTMYLKWCTAHGERTTETNLRPGTAVFVWNAEKKNYSHVGLYIGEGYVIQAKGTQNGVVKTKLNEKKKDGSLYWSHWGELKDVNYGDAPEPAPEPDPKPETPPTLRKGAKGEWVTLMQADLISKGYDCGSKGADGIFGNDTLKALKQFQQDHGLTADGVCGPKSWEALQTAESNLYTVHIPHLPKYQAEALIKQYAGSWMEVE